MILFLDSRSYLIIFLIVILPLDWIFHSFVLFQHLYKSRLFGTTCSYIALKSRRHNFLDFMYYMKFSCIIWNFFYFMEEALKTIRKIQGSKWNTFLDKNKYVSLSTTVIFHTQEILWNANRSKCVLPTRNTRKPLYGLVNNFLSYDINFLLI